ncbi:helix-turn-helix domain-containing protein [Gordonibacter sp. RACS_AR49]|nr:helix-turn-helix domain-containing protein [Gordonibacter sp. RACS_AR49]
MPAPTGTAPSTRTATCASTTPPAPSPSPAKRFISPPIEYKLLALLARNTGKVLTHNAILKEVWGNALASDLPSLRVFMATLRKKIERDPAHPAYLQTHVGIGYRMLRK